MKSFKNILVKNLKNSVKILKNKVYQGDCLETLSKMLTGSVKAVVMDGPYILHTKKGAGTKGQMSGLC